MASAFGDRFQLRLARLLGAIMAAGALAGSVARADLASPVDLPKLSEEAPLDLGTIPAAEVAKCTFRIITPSNDSGPLGNAYICEPASGGWKVLMDTTTPVATLKFEKDHLQFRWEPGASRSAVGGLRNCLLQVGYGKKPVMIALRKPLRAPAEVLDLHRDSETIALDVDDAPIGEKLSVEVFGLTGYTTPVTFDPENKQAILKEPVRIIVKPATEKVPGVQVNVTLSKLGSKLSVEIQPLAVTFDGQSTRPFTMKNMSDSVEKTKTRLTNTKTKLAAAEKQVAPLEAKLDSMNTTATRSKKQQQAFDTQLSKIQGQLDTAKQKVDDLKKQIPVLQNHLDFMPDLVKLAGDLHEHAAVEYRVLYAIGKQQIVLFATDKAPIEPPVPPKDENENTEGAPPP